jgi:hypothetical protein
MGKSTVATFLQDDHALPVLSADAVVHALYAPGGAAVGPVGVAFPAALSTPGGGIDRAALSAAVVGDEAAMRRLEGLVHPLVEAARLEFVRQVCSCLLVGMGRGGWKRAGRHAKRNHHHHLAPNPPPRLLLRHTACSLLCTRSTPPRRSWCLTSRCCMRLGPRRSWTWCWS